jgi:hypothetical protein
MGCKIERKQKGRRNGQEGTGEELWGDNGEENEGADSDDDGVVSVIARYH